ncbi:M1 family metallopeptidase [Brumimicrobium mesophilum]|uniref:M1 family metallopeptidase n=1 Tax=Brumimicrobium mesophilum TaxID=392717 RepID=UPI000D143EFD|nr:M1 family aminopeptidase [Brumimicrobium mesophilum]
MKRIFTVIVSIGLLCSCGTSKGNSSQKTVTDESGSVSVNEGGIKENAPISVNSSEEVIERPHYNPSATILTGLKHTKLEVDFMWDKSQMNGKATLTCSPHFYSTDSLILDAKAMEIHSVKLNGKDLNYKYNDAKFLRIKLDKEYSRSEEYTVVIDYIAKPEEKVEGGSSAISSDKGLYFINPKGENKNQMTHIWTQGETEASSVWFPTIDRPNQNTTQEIYITVEDKYKTLSNGKFMSSQKNKDGTRTDYWKQDLPHVPYLFMMAVGEFAIVKDTYTKPDGTIIPLHYYVEPEWEEHAQAIFGETPAMIEYFSELLGVDYKWDKYHQVVVREFVSGAMENTGGVVFGDFVYQTKRELIDSDNHAIIAHELFHHWFGNLVTCESWANLPMNESFANYSQYLWDEKFHGRDEAEYNAEKEADGYYQSSKQLGYHDMIWFDYDQKEDMFDAHSYNKGGRILHMLRYYLGDDAFFNGLKTYLNDNAFQPVEVHHLRLAFEEVAGEDLNWFFNQWFLSSYHPKLDISQEVKDGEVTVRIDQVQDLELAPLYKLPMKIGVYANGGKTSHEIVVDKNINSFTFDFKGDIENIVVDEERTILGVLNHDKPREWYVHQFYNAPRYKDREKAVTFGSRSDSPEAKQMIMDALDDDFWYIRQLAISKLDKFGEENQSAIFEQLKIIAETDESSKVRSSALSALSSDFFKAEFEGKTRSILTKAIESDSSYLVISKALNGLTKGTENDIDNVMSMSKKLEKERSSALKAQLIGIYRNYGTDSNLDFMSEAITSGDISGYDMIGGIMNFASFYKDQNVKTRLKYFHVLERLSDDGGAYVNAVLPIVLNNLAQVAQNEVVELEKELQDLEKTGSAGEATVVQGKLTQERIYQKKLITLINKVAK